MTGRRVVTALAVTIAVAVAGCGVPLDESPRAINRTTVTVPTPPSTAPADGGPTVTVYFLRRDRLVGQVYEVQGPPTLAKAVTTVLRNPGRGALGDLRTSVPPGTELRSVRVTAGTARVDLSREINNVSGQAQLEAFAQIVFTALGFPGVVRVAFEIDGKPVDTPTDHNNQAAVTASDYDRPLNPR